MRVAVKPKGRPPEGNPTIATISAAVTVGDKHKVLHAAAAAGLSVSAYLRRKLGLDKEVEG